MFKFGSLAHYDTGNQKIVDWFYPQQFQLDTRTNYPSDKLRKCFISILLWTCQMSREQYKIYSFFFLGKYNETFLPSVSTFLTSPNRSWCDGSTFSSDSMENMMLKLYLRILTGTFAPFWKNIIYCYILVLPSEVFFITKITKVIRFISIRTATLWWMTILFHWGDISKYFLRHYID